MVYYNMLIKEINLFEYQKYSWENVFEFLEINTKLSQEKFKIRFDQIIQNLWIDRFHHIPSEILYNPSASKEQRIFEVTNHYIKPKNYIGSIEFSFQNQLYRINLNPKIFYLNDYLYTKENYNAIQLHIIWWLSEITDLIPPSYQYSLSEMDNANFLDVYVIIFSSFTLNILENETYRYYNSINEDLRTVKGQINFTKYINNYSNGNQHNINCEYDDFNIDNNFNQIIKYVCILLKKYTSNKRILQNLESILFILDDVSNIEITINDCDKVILNPIFTEYKVILDYCKLFINGTNSYNRNHELDVFALIIPTEKLFEKLIKQLCSQITHQNFINITNKRPGRHHLAIELLEEGKIEKRFNLINDIIIETQKNYIIVDTKYKTLNESIKDKNISQLDMYQMVGYAISSGVNNIKLIYPCTIFKDSSAVAKYIVEDLLGKESQLININALKINIFHDDNINILNNNFLLTEFFKPTKTRAIYDLLNLIELN